MLRVTTLTDASESPVSAQGSASTPPASGDGSLVTTDFVQSRVVEAVDIDMLGHVSNLAIARWAQDVAVAHSVAVGLDFKEYERIGGVFVLRRHEIDYLRSAFLGELIVARTRLASAKGASCVRTMEFYRGADRIAESTTTWVYVCTGAQRPSRIPDHVRVAFGQARLRSVPPGSGPPSQSR
jgi:acyl-CoA thioester hydrolase